MRLKRVCFIFITIFITMSFGRQDIDLNVTSKLKRELIPLGKTTFMIINLKSQKETRVDLTGEDFILISVREHGSDGRFYAVDSDGTVWWSGAITSGAKAFRSPSGVFNIIQKKRYHMSTKYPDENGIIIWTIC